MGKLKKQARKTTKIRPRAKQHQKQMSFPSETLRKMWDRKDTVTENYKRMGVRTNLNSFSRRAMKEVDRELDKRDEMELIADIDDKTPLPQVENELLDNLDDIQTKTSFRKRVMHEDHQIYCRELYKKYGDDFVAMARDIKLNFYQYTPKQLKQKMFWWMVAFKDQTAMSKTGEEEEETTNTTTKTTNTTTTTKLTTTKKNSVANKLPKKRITKTTPLTSTKSSTTKKST